MLLFLTDDQATELSFLLDQALKDLGYEMAATDDARCRADLARRRQTVHDVVGALEAAAEAEAELRSSSGARGATDRTGISPWTA